MGSVPGDVIEELSRGFDVATEDMEVVFFQLPCFEITKWRPIAAKLFLENEVSLQGKCLSGCKESEHRCK